MPNPHSRIRNPDYIGEEGFETMAQLEDATLVVSAQSDAAWLRGTLAAVEEEKVVALANKEPPCSRWSFIRETCKTKGSLLSVDSEHNAIF